MAPKGKSAKGYARAETLPVGTEIEAGFGSSVRRWRLGPAVGVGGFGDIYSAKEIGPNGPKAGKDFPFVVKVEPHGNGPLFVEMHFYMRNAKMSDIDDFVKTNKLKTLGMPAYIASGSHEYNKNKYRFVVMERFGKDLWHRFTENGRTLPTHTVYRIAIQMLDVYQYIHSRTYVHGDLKGANILFGLKKNAENQAYLVDFGLASHYIVNEYKKDPKKAHNGTIEYTSRDAHNGVSTRRGDMEILGYNIVQWLAGALPWEIDLRHPATVQAQKEKYMSDIPGFLKKSFTKSPPPAAVTSFLQYVSKMEYDETPDYKGCRQMFESGLKSIGYSLSCNLDFTPVRKEDKIKKIIPVAQQSSEDEGEIEEQTSTKKKRVAKKVTASKKVEKKTATRRKKTANSTSTSMSDNTIDSTSDDAVVANSSRRVLRSITSPHNVTSTSVDIFEDSCIETPPKQGTKRKHTKRFEVEYCSDEEVVVQTTVKKKCGVVKEETRSWKKCPTIINGRSVNRDKD